MIIGMVGLIGSGKGTVGDYLCEKYHFQRESFAKPLKDAAAIIFNWPRHLLEGDTPESRIWRDQVDVYWSEKLGWEVTPRDVLQKLGTEAGRQVFGNPLWTAALINRLVNHLPSFQSMRESPFKPIDFVITDVRFENEMKALRELGAKIIRVKRGPEPNWFERAKFHLRNHPEESSMFYSLNGLVEKIHISEYGWVNSEMDYVIPNDSSLEELHICVDKIVNQLSTSDR